MELRARHRAVIDPVSPHDGTKITLHGGGWFYGEVYTHCASRGRR
ncbi:MAG: hypothetical protein U0527_04505 [Candidatus Eisenbacteria bacterium]